MIRSYLNMSGFHTLHRQDSLGFFFIFELWTVMFGFWWGFCGFFGPPA
jgi:hypothetical protein